MADSTQSAKFNCLFCNKLCFSQHALQLHAQSCRGQLLASASPPLPRLAELPTIASTPGGNSGVALMPRGLFSSSESSDESPWSPDSTSLDTTSTTSSSDDVDAAGTTSTPSQSMTQSIITDESLNSIIGDFMSWLEEGPVSVIEQMVKKRRLSSDDQLVPIRNNLRHLLLTISTLQSVEVTSLSLSSLVQLSTVKAVMSHLEQRKLGPGRLHQLALLLKKIAVYLCSAQSSSSMLFISPQTMPSWTCIDSYCSQATKKRKMLARDRVVLQQASEETMTSDELTVLVRGCLMAMDDLMDSDSSSTVAFDVAAAKRFAEYFITACFVLLLAPRQQVFRQLTMDTLFRPSTSNANYVIKMTAEQSKVGQPILLRVPDVLTSKFDFYLDRVLPILTALEAPAMTNEARQSQPVFVQRGGNARQDFSCITRAVTKQFIGRAINAHRFRHSMATTFYSHQNSSETLMRRLAETMNHDSQTQAQYYVHQQRLDAQEQLQSMLIERVEQRQP